MKEIKVLDCTLRDGGYCNQWKFGFSNTKKIIHGLQESGIDIIECGFLTNSINYNKDITKYTNMEEIATIIPEDRFGKTFVCMLNYGEYDVEKIPEYDGKSVDGLRVAFHKKDMIPALEICEKIQEKGYKIFIQAMISLSYSDEEFLTLIKKVNQFKPYAFYIVDSFGVMKQKDLCRLFYLVEHNLADGIAIGYHSHNNMQLAFSNAQALVEMSTKRQIIMDTSVYGMGRGAGNLNTELFVEYLNNRGEAIYQLKPLLTIIDETLNLFYQQNPWGYSLPNYLSAKHNTHPNYAGYLDAKRTLTVENMDEIFFMMNDLKRLEYDEEYIEALYEKYMTVGSVQENHLNELKNKIEGKEVLLIAPGKSSIEEQDKIIKCSKRKNIVVISINYEYPGCKTDFIFLSNLRRFRELEIEKYKKCIITSNIPNTEVYLQTNYRDLLNSVEAVRDNAGMMLINYLIKLKAQKILLAGLDGYSSDPELNYAKSEMSFYTKKGNFVEKNKGMNQVLRKYSQKIDIEFVTQPKYISL